MLKVKNKLGLFVATMLLIALIFPMFVTRPTEAAVVPAKVTLSKISYTGTNKITIQWKKAARATNYAIFYKPAGAGAGKWVRIATVGNTTSYTHTSSAKFPLKAGNKYTYTVRGYNRTSKKYGAYDTKGLTTSAGLVPGKPVVTKAAAGTNSITVRWNKAINCTNYVVFYKPANAGAGKWVRLATLGTTARSYTHTSSTKFPLKAGQSYTYTVRGYNSRCKNYGAYDTKGVTATLKGSSTAAVTPGRVTLVKASAIGSNRINVQWKPTTNATEYAIFYKPADAGAGKWVRVATVKSNVTSYTHTSSAKFPLEAGKSYVYTVRAYNTASKRWGSYDTIGVTAKVPATEITKLDTPQPTAKVNSDDTITVTWNPVPNAEYYEVYRRNVENTAWLKLDSYVTGNSYVDSKPYKKRYNIYTVRAVKGGIKSDYVSGTDPIILGEYDEDNQPELPEIDVKAFTTKVIELTNQERAKYGAAPLIYHPGLEKAAMLRAQEISVNFSHTRPNGENYETAFFECGVGNASDENIGMGYGSPEAVVEGWINSPGHHNAMIRDDNKYIGVGFYRAPNQGYYWVQDYANADPDQKGTMTFDANGGTFADNTTVYTITGPTGKRVYMKDIPIPTKSGYVFDCWLYKKENLYITSNPFGPGTATEFIARWKPAS